MDLREGCCPKCRHNRVLYVTRVPDETDNTYGEFRIAVIKVGTGFLGEKVGKAGPVEAFVCRGCGFTEFYTKEPHTIPIDGERVREIVGPPPKAPYR